MPLTDAPDDEEILGHRKAGAERTPQEFRARPGVAKSNPNANPTRIFFPTRSNPIFKQKSINQFEKKTKKDNNQQPQQQPQQQQE